MFRVIRSESPNSQWNKIRVESRAFGNYTNLSKYTNLSMVLISCFLCDCFSCRYERAKKPLSSFDSDIIKYRDYIEDVQVMSFESIGKLTWLPYLQDSGLKK